MPTVDGPENAVIRSIQQPVGDVPAAVAFYAEAFGLRTRFVDGTRYAVLDTGGFALALAAGEEDVTGGVPAAVFKVSDVAGTVRKVVEAGGVVVRDPVRGSHEMRAVVRDPWGVAVVLYQSI